MDTAAVTERMRESISRGDLVVAVLAGIAGVAGSFALTGYTRQFVVAPIDRLVVDATPGAIVAFTIQNVGEEGHYLHIALSVAIAVGLLGAVALVGLRAASRTDEPITGGAIAAVGSWGIVAAVTTEPVLALGAAVPVAVMVLIGTTPLDTSDPDAERRRVLVSGAGALAFLGAAVGLSRFTASGETFDPAQADVDPEVADMLQAAETNALGIQGDVPGLVSTFDEFYNVDIAEFDPELSAEDWSLTITGEVDEETTVTFEELTDMPTERRFVTLRCVGEDLNGQKLDTAVWTGTPIRPLLEEADPDGECGCAMLRAEDGYFVQFPIEALEDGFLAWEMNGVALPQEHGHPVRVLIPGHWGETNVKWLEEIELLDEEMDGYWEERGWHGTGPVNTVAKLWSTTMLDENTVEVAGHAYAGTRGIERVEVSIDDGETWTDAELSDPLPGDDVWRQWRYEFEPEGSHEVVVRAVDGEGTLQPEDESDSFPSGATGWVSTTVNAMDAS